MWIPSLTLGSGLSSLYVQAEFTVRALVPDLIGSRLHIQR